MWRILCMHTLGALVGLLLCGCAGAAELLYVGNSAEETIAVIDIPRHEILRKLHVEGNPDDVVGSSDGRILYVSVGTTGNASAMAPDAGAVLAVAADTGRTLWKLPVSGWPHHISLSRDDRRLYVPVFDRQYVLVVDTKQHAVVTRMWGMWGMHVTRLSADDRVLYAGSMLTNMLFAFDTRGGKLVHTIPFAQAVRPFAITADQHLAYVQTSNLHGFHVVDLKEEKVLQTVALPALSPQTHVPERWPYNVDHGLVLSPNELYLLAAGSIAGIVEVYERATLKAVKTIPVGADPNWIVFSGDGRYAYVSCRGAGEVSVIDMESLSEVKRIRDVGAAPARMRVVRRVP
jgi:YVTN family beta-propeller protein